MVGAPSTHCGEWRRGGSAQPQAVRWVRLAWNVGDALIWTHELHLSTHTGHLLSLISDVTYPFNLCLCISIFLPPPLLLVNPWHDRAPLLFGPPWLPVSLADNGDICLYKEAALPCPSFLPRVLSLSLSSSSSLLNLSSSLSVNCDNSLICHRPVCLFLGALQEAYQCKGASELCDWVNTGTGAR